MVLRLNVDQNPMMMMMMVVAHRHYFKFEHDTTINPIKRILRYSGQNYQFIVSMKYTQKNSIYDVACNELLINYYFGYLLQNNPLKGHATTTTFITGVCYNFFLIYCD